MVGTQPRMLGPAAKDITVDSAGDVQGISVAPSWRELPVHLIPKRLRPLAPEAIGSNTSAVWRHGDGAFLDRAVVAPHLELRVDAADHGVIAANATMTLADYGSALAATQPDWVEDET